MAHVKSETLYLVRLSHTHETFRKPELESIASTLGVSLDIIDYRENSPFCIIRIGPSFPTNHQRHMAAADFISRSILARSIHELYATGSNYNELHRAVKAIPPHTWTPHRNVSFKFTIDVFCGKRSTAQQRDIVESFGYLPFQGRIKMDKPDEEFVIFEEWDFLTPEEQSALSIGRQVRKEEALPTGGGELTSFSERKPSRLFFGRYVGESRRDLIIKHDLKKRPYISTTSMDAELALVTANLAKADAGKLFLDPFTGTGGFMVAAAELGAIVLGSDIDGRSFRGKGLGLEKGVGANFNKYCLTDRFGDCWTSDLTNTPLRLPGTPNGKNQRWLDGIICDPPYGVREGLKVLGKKEHDPNNANGRAVHDGPYFVDGVPSHTLPGFVAPKKPYSFNRMLDDILDFAARTLVGGGRLAFWMPCANDADEEFPIPQHMMLELKHSCIQVFNKWSRRLLVYERVSGDVAENVSNGHQATKVNNSHGRHADDLNQFRRMYFRGFAEETPNNDYG